MVKVTTGKVPPEKATGTSGKGAASLKTTPLPNGKSINRDSDGDEYYYFGDIYGQTSGDKSREKATGTSREAAGEVPPEEEEVSSSNRKTTPLRHTSRVQNEYRLNDHQRKDYMKHETLVRMVQALIIYDWGLDIYKLTGRPLTSKEQADEFRDKLKMGYKFYCRDPIIGVFVREVSYVYLIVEGPRAKYDLSGDDLVTMFTDIDYVVLNCLGRIYKT